MPNIIKSPYEMIRSSESDITRKILSEFEDALEYDRSNRARNYRNWKIYHAVDEGQAEDDLLNDLRNEDRHYDQYNITAPKVDTLAGALMSEKFDIDLKPREGTRNSLTEACKTSWYTDKDLCHYDYHMGKTIIGGLVYGSELKMKMSTKYDPRTNICIEAVPDGFLLRDPHWITDDDNQCEKAWEVFHLTPLQIKERYPKARGPLLEASIMRQKQIGNEYDEYDKDFNEQMRMGFRGNLYRAIEYHWIETIKTKRVIGKILGSTHYIPFPITKDHNTLEEYMIRNNVDPDTMRESDYDDKIHKLMTIAPELVPYNLLDGADNISAVQPRRLPYFHFTTSRAFGQSKGIVDDIYDLQRNINRGEIKLKDLIQSAAGGGKVASEDVWDTPDKKQEFQRNATNPRYVTFADGDELARGKIVEYLNQNNYNPAIIDQISRHWDVVDRISKVPAAMAAMSESANESGVLFENKLQVARMGILTLVDRVKELRKNIFESYYNQWQLAYNDLEREFTTLDGKRSTVLNERFINNGKIYIKNRPAMIPRSTVIITESRSNPTKLMSKRILYSELFDRAVQTNPEAASIFFKELMKTMDLDDEASFELKRFTFLQTIRDYKRIQTEISTLDATAKQAALTGLQAMIGIEQLMGGAPEEEIPVSQIPEEEVPKPVDQLPPPEETENVLVPA